MNSWDHHVDGLTLRYIDIYYSVGSDAIMTAVWVVQV